MSKAYAATRYHNDCQHQTRLVRAIDIRKSNGKRYEEEAPQYKVTKDGSRRWSF